MACRRKQHSLSDQSDGQSLNSMDYLAFRYMEMCRVDSSTDSDSEISPRWSDTSTMGCTSSTPERVTFHPRTLPLTHKPAGRHGCHSMFLDPYDGSSEDSDESSIDVSAKGSRRPRQPGGGGGGGGGGYTDHSRRSMFHHPASAVKNDMRDEVTEKQHVLDVQMKCGSDSELTCRGFGGRTSNDSAKHTPSMGVELHRQPKDSDPHTSRSVTPGPAPPVEVGTLLHGSSERPPCPFHLRSVHKRKLVLPGLEVLELEQRKKQCLVNMVDEDLKEVDSASEVC